MRVYTIKNGTMQDGAIVNGVVLDNPRNHGNRVVPAIVIGKIDGNRIRSFLPVRLTFAQRMEMAKYGFTTVNIVKLAYVRSNAGYKTILKSQYYNYGSPEALCVFIKNISRPNGMCKCLHVHENTDYIEPIYRPFQGELLVRDTSVQTFYRDLECHEGDHFLDRKPVRDSKSYTEVLLNREESVAVIPRNSEFSVECYSDPENRNRLAHLPKGDSRRSSIPIINFLWDGTELTRNPF